MEVPETYGDLQYAIDEKVFEERGYTFQKLYAAEYPVWWKEINGMTLWCWVNQKSIELQDYFGFTKLLLDFFVKEKDSDKVVTSKMWNDFRYLSIYFDSKTGEIRHRQDVREEITAEIVKDKKIKKKKRFEVLLDRINDFKYGDGKEWREIGMQINVWQSIVDEVNVLTKGNWVLNRDHYGVQS